MTRPHAGPPTGVSKPKMLTIGPPQTLVEGAGVCERLIGGLRESP